MKKQLMLIGTLAILTVGLIGCEQPPASNTAANKAANAGAAPAADLAAVEVDLKKMMGDFTTALNGSDVAALDKMYSDDYTLIDQDGVMQTKAARLESVKSGKVKWEGLKFSDLKIKTHPAGDGAVIVGRATGKVTIDGKSDDRDSMVTWVVGKTKDKGWQFLNAQITDVKAGAKKPEDDKKDVAANTGAAANANSGK